MKQGIAESIRKKGKKPDLLHFKAGRRNGDRGKLGKKQHAAVVYPVVGDGYQFGPDRPCFLIQLAPRRVKRGFSRFNMPSGQLPGVLTALAAKQPCSAAARRNHHIPRRLMFRSGFQKYNGTHADFLLFVLFIIFLHREAQYSRLFGNTRNRTEKSKKARRPFGRKSAAMHM